VLRAAVLRIHAQHPVLEGNGPHDVVVHGRGRRDRDLEGPRVPVPDVGRELQWERVAVLGSGQVGVFAVEVAGKVESDEDIPAGIDPLDEPEPIPVGECNRTPTVSVWVRPPRWLWWRPRWS
jgi:hypothetical protein